MTDDNVKQTKELLTHMAEIMKLYKVTHLKCGDMEMVRPSTYDPSQDNDKMTPDMSDVPSSDENILDQLR